MTHIPVNVFWRRYTNIKKNIFVNYDILIYFLQRYCVYLLVACVVCFQIRMSCFLAVYIQYTYHYNYIMFVFCFNFLFNIKNAVFIWVARMIFVLHLYIIAFMLYKLYNFHMLAVAALRDGTVISSHPFYFKIFVLHGQIQIIVGYLEFVPSLEKKLAPPLHAGHTCQYVDRAIIIVYETFSRHAISPSTTWNTKHQQQQHQPQQNHLIFCAHYLFMC